MTWAIVLLGLTTSHAGGVLAGSARLIAMLQLSGILVGWLLVVALGRASQTEPLIQVGAVMFVAVTALFFGQRQVRQEKERQRDLVNHLGEQATRAGELAQLRHDNGSKSRLLAMVSHDLRQPVHALGLMLGRFREQAAAASLRNEIEAVNDVVESLSKSLSVLMAVTRLDAGLVVARPETIALERLFVSLSREFQDLATGKGLQLTLISNHLAVTTDPAQLRTILENLIGNAIKYTPKGSVLVTARAVDSRTASIEVRDSGIGMLAEELPKVFEPFVRLRYRNTEAEGLGLGLAIVKQTAEILGISIKVQSTLGRGTVFSLELPLADVAATLTAPAPVSAQLRGLRVVLIDNDATVLESMARTLEEWGCRVIAAGGWEDLEVKLGMTVSPIELILTDYHLDGGLSGYEIVKRLRKDSKTPIPAILLTGDVEIRHGPESEAASLEIAYKPLSRDRLAGLIHDTVASYGGR